MPYITQARRDLLAAHDRGAVAPGELSYVVTRLCIEYVEHVGFCYDALNDVLGALEGAKLEFYRRMVAPYEDRKLAQNGDVYPK